MLYAFPEHARNGVLVGWRGHHVSEIDNKLRVAEVDITSALPSPGQGVDLCTHRVGKRPPTRLSAPCPVPILPLWWQRGFKGGGAVNFPTLRIDAIRHENALRVRQARTTPARCR